MAPKGRPTSRADWESEVYAEARDNRSAIESLMFTLKRGFDFGEVARRGLSAVYAELLEKVLASNIRLTAVQARATLRGEGPRPPGGQAVRFSPA